MNDRNGLATGTAKELPDEMTDVKKRLSRSSRAVKAVISPISLQPRKVSGEIWSSAERMRHFLGLFTAYS